MDTQAKEALHPKLIGRKYLSADGEWYVYGEFPKRGAILGLFASISKAWPVLAEHATHIDGEFDNAVKDLRRAVDRLLDIRDAALSALSKEQPPTGHDSEGLGVPGAEPRVGLSVGYVAEDSDPLSSSTPIHNALPPQADMLAMLREVVDYRHGNGKYNFTSLPDEHRENEAFDAWEDIERRIKILIQP